MTWNTTAYDWLRGDPSSALHFSGFGVVAGIALLYLGEGIPRVQRDILQVSDDLSLALSIHKNVSIGSGTTYDGERETRIASSTVFMES